MSPMPSCPLDAAGAADPCACERGLCPLHCGRGDPALEKFQPPLFTGEGVS